MAYLTVFFHKKVEVIKSTQVTNDGTTLYSVRIKGDNDDVYLSFDNKEHFDLFTEVKE